MVSNVILLLHILMWQLTTTSNLWKDNNLLQKYFTVPANRMTPSLEGIN